jgi:hypothetical protein
MLCGNYFAWEGIPSNDIRRGTIIRTLKLSRPLHKSEPIGRFGHSQSIVGL